MSVPHPLHTQNARTFIPVTYFIHSFIFTWLLIVKDRLMHHCFLRQSHQAWTLTRDGGPGVGAGVVGVLTALWPWAGGAGQPCG